ncbi:Uncharacterized protein OBRU01_11434, partial [Operophtera brumata]
MIKLMHQGAMNGAQDWPRLQSSGPIILTLSKEPLTMDQQLHELVAEPSKEFKKFTRMSSVDFEYLLNKQNTQLREAIPARTRLAVTLRYLATGDDYQSLHFLFKISPQVISQIIPTRNIGCQGRISDGGVFTNTSPALGEEKWRAPVLFEIRDIFHAERLITQQK